MKVALMGSPEFAVPCLRALAAVHEVVLVVSQPDKPAGRGGKLTPPAAKVAAEALGLRVIQPRSARTGELEQALRASGAELAAVVAYGKILPAAVLTATPRGCINVHASVLPRYRGAAPIQWAVINGEAETGVSIMQLDAGMDTGPVYAEGRVAIGADETAGELLDRLAPIGAAALIEVIAAIAGGTARAGAAGSRARDARADADEGRRRDRLQRTRIGGRRADPRRRSVAGRARAAARTEREVVPRARSPMAGGANAAGPRARDRCGRRARSRAATARS